MMAGGWPGVYSPPAASMNNALLHSSKNCGKRSTWLRHYGVFCAASCQLLLRMVGLLCTAVVPHQWLLAAASP
jgi:hypothetical protein